MKIIIIILGILIIILISLLFLLPKNTNSFINTYSQLNQDIKAIEPTRGNIKKLLLDNGYEYIGNNQLDDSYKLKELLNNVIIGSTDLKISKHICFFT